MQYVLPTSFLLFELSFSKKSLTTEFSWRALKDVHKHIDVKISKENL